MSPSEADLRAALREGEGDGVNPYDIIYAARQARARHRTVLLSAAAAVVFVGGAATGVSVLVNTGGQGNGGGGSMAAGQMNSAASAPQTRPQAGVHNDAGGPVEPGTEIPSACATPAATRRSNPANRHGPLISGPIKAFIVCAYANYAGPRSAAAAQPVVVTGPAARSLARSLRQASATAMPQPCPMIASTGSIALRIIPIAPDNRRLPALIATVTMPACASTVSNGSVMRYGWRLPADVRALLHLNPLEPGPVQLTPLSGHASGSPPR